MDYDEPEDLDGREAGYCAYKRGDKFDPDETYQWRLGYNDAAAEERRIETGS